MRIGFISDLHIDINREYPVMDVLAGEAAREQLELLAVAGDISETPDETVEEMERLEERLRSESGCRLFYVPGNHDMWNINCPQSDSDAIYSRYLGDENCLSGRSIRLGDRGGQSFLIGDIGWYDYSFAGTQYSREELDGMSISGRIWQDRLYNSWTEDNPGKNRLMLRQIEETMTECEKTPGASFIAVTHMLPIKEFCVPAEQPDWDFFNAYLGSAALGRLYGRHNVKYAVCGHVHYRSRLEKDGITWICPCLGYHTEWPLYGLKDNSLLTHLQDALQIIDYDC